MSDSDIERLKAELKDANAVIHVLQQEACNRAGVPMPSQRSLVDKLREEIERLRAGRAAERDDIIEQCAKVALVACLVPPDGGQPTEEERLVCEEACARIRLLKGGSPARS